MSTQARQLVTTRLVAAPRDLVWEAWTRADHLDKWWGPRGFTTTTESMDFRVGGEWRFEMRHAEYGVYPNRVRYTEILSGERLAYDHDSGVENDPNGFTNLVTFTTEGSGTRVTMTATLPSDEAVRVAKEHGATEGGKQTLERLSERLAEAEAGDLVITRTFAAPLARVWAAWTEPSRLAKWWGPSGFGMEVAKHELRPGGLFHYAMRPPNSTDVWWGRMVYREIVPMARLVWVNSFSDAEGGLTRHPLAATWPAEILNVVSFREVEGHTEFVIRGRPIRASEEELAIFQGVRSNVEGGFAGTFAQLDAYLAAEG